MKFKDADLLGLPLRLTVSPRTLERGAVEIKGRSASRAEDAPLDGVLTGVQAVRAGSAGGVR